MLSNLWVKVRAFFVHSWVIFLARLQTLIGFVLAVAGSVDWSAISHWDFTTPRQTVWLGIGMLVNGIATEYARRAGTVTSTSDQLIPVNLADKVEVKS
jgi:hypothetical protein